MNITGMNNKSLRTLNCMDDRFISERTNELRSKINTGDECCWHDADTWCGLLFATKIPPIDLVTGNLITHLNLMPMTDLKRWLLPAFRQFYPRSVIASGRVFFHPRCITIHPFLQKCATVGADITVVVKQSVLRLDKGFWMRHRRHIQGCQHIA